MSVFVWAKMQAESGETLNEIIQRKEAERSCGAGAFWWGVGTSLGDDVERAAKDNGLTLPVLFSRMLSPPKKKDSAPESVYLWEGWQAKNERGRIPMHVIVTGGSDLGRAHYALVCFSEIPLRLQDHGAFDPGNCWTYKSRNDVGGGKMPGSSQVTSLLWDRKSGSHGIGPYRMGFKASLVQPWAVKLTQGRSLSADERAMIRSYREGTDWMSLVRRLRKQ